jgi:hypothetical protein
MQTLFCVSTPKTSEQLGCHVLQQQTQIKYINSELLIPTPD